MSWVLRWYFYIQYVPKKEGFWNQRKIQIMINEYHHPENLADPHDWPWKVKRTGQFPNIWHPTLLWDDHDGDFDGHYTDNDDVPKLFFFLYIIKPAFTPPLFSTIM